MTTIVLVRHGQNDWVNKHRLAGWIPGVHLNEVGQKQAKDAAKRLAKLPFKAIYSSPVERCLETATELARPHKLPIEQLPDVGEVRYGEWEGAKIKKLAKKPEEPTRGPCDLALGIGLLARVSSGSHLAPSPLFRAHRPRGNQQSSPGLKGQGEGGAERFRRR